MAHMQNTDRTPGQAAPSPSGQRHQAGAFDIRTFIAALIGIYGVVLLVVGILGTSQADLRKAGGTNVDLWAGIAMMVFAAAFQIWARLRPVVVDEAELQEGSEEESDGVREEEREAGRH